jgi:hypothetical protein
MRMTSEDCDALARGTVPNTNSLVVRSRNLKSVKSHDIPFPKTTHNPGHLMVELNCTNIVEVAVQREKTATVLGSDV